jgi:DNA-binding response OmpR family regulator
MATKLGAVRSLKKPFRPRELLAAVAECLESTDQGSNDESEVAIPARGGQAGA